MVRIGGDQPAWRGWGAFAALLVVALASVGVGAASRLSSTTPLSTRAALSEPQGQASLPALGDEDGHDLPPVLPPFAEEEDDEHDAAAAAVGPRSPAPPALTSCDASLPLRDSESKRPSRREPAVPTGPPFGRNATLL